MSRLKYNNQSGSLNGALTNSGTTITFAAAPSFSTIVSPDIVVLELESGTANFEIVYLTAYTAAATTGTILRAQEGTTGVAHGASVSWVHAPTVADFTILRDYSATASALTDSATNYDLGLSLSNVPAGLYIAMIDWSATAKGSGYVRCQLVDGSSTLLAPLTGTSWCSYVADNKQRFSVITVLVLASATTTVKLVGSAVQAIGNYTINERLLALIPIT